VDSIQDLSPTCPVIFYDKIGNGRSTHPDTQTDTFWTSWRGMLGAEDAVAHLPGLNKLVLSDSLAAMPLWTRPRRPERVH